MILGTQINNNLFFKYAGPTLGIPANILLIYGIFSRTRNIGYPTIMALLIVVPIVNIFYLFMLLTKNSTKRTKHENI